MPLAAARAGVRRAPFLPTQLTSLGLWLDAAQITGAADGAAVATWQDRSGNAWDAAQVTLAKQPIYRASGALLTPSGRPVVQFDGISSQLDCSAGSSSIQGQSVFVVARVTSFPANTDPTYTFVGSTAPGGLALQLTATGTAIRMEDDNTSGIYSTSYNPGTALFRQYSCMFFANGSTGSQHIFADGTEVGVGNTLPTALSGTNFRRIGGAGSATSSKYLTGAIAEVVIYTRLLASAERQQVEAYLRAKHGTP